MVTGKVKAILNSEVSTQVARILLIICALVMLLGLAACNKTRLTYQQGQHALQAQEYDNALAKFEEVLPGAEVSKQALIGKARCLYELERYDEALPLFEKFLTWTERVRAQYRDERYDADFYRDKCKQALGIEVPQDPEAIPEEKMRY